MTLRFVGLSATLLASLPTLAAAQSTPQKAPAPPTLAMSRYQMTAGDLNGDGFAEAIIYDSTSKGIRVFDYSGSSPIQSMSVPLADNADLMAVADVDGDGKPELIVGAGLGGYNPKSGPQTDVTIRIYKPSAKTDWSPKEIYRKASERPEVTTLEVKDLDGDGQPEILFAYYASKYISDIRIAKRVDGEWKISDVASIRMGGHVSAGDVLQTGHPQIVVARPYGDPPDGSTVAIGDAFVLDGTTRIPLPVTRGASVVAVGDLDGDNRPEIVINDGWHSNYGKLARCRLGIITRQNGEWKYTLVEDLPDHIRFEALQLIDLTGDGLPEIVGLASRASSLGNSVRVYEHTKNGWRGMTVAEEAQAFASGDFHADHKQELVFAGQPPLPVALATATPKWDAALGAAVDAPEVDAGTLVGRPAPALKGSEWIGEPQTLSALKGKVVLLDFWATWCKPCIEMYPTMRSWVTKYGPDGLVIIGITNLSAQTAAKVRSWLAKEKLPWPVTIDPRNTTHIAYGVSPIPHTFLIDRRGIVRLSHEGGGDLTPIEAALKSLLAEKPGTTK